METVKRNRTTDRLPTLHRSFDSRLSRLFKSESRWQRWRLGAARLAAPARGVQSVPLAPGGHSPPNLGTVDLAGAYDWFIHIKINHVPLRDKFFSAKKTTRFYATLIVCRVVFFPFRKWRQTRRSFIFARARLLQVMVARSTLFGRAGNGKVPSAENVLDLKAWMLRCFFFFFNRTLSEL